MAEELNIEIRQELCSLSEEKLTELCNELTTQKPTKKGKLAAIQSITEYLEKEELGVDKLQAILKAVKTKNQNSNVIKKESAEKPNEKTEVDLNSKPQISVRREFKIAGQIGPSNQKDRLSFSSWIWSDSRRIS